MRSARASTRYVFTLTFSALVAGWSLRASAQPPMQAGGLAPPPPMQSGGLAPPPPGSGPPPAQTYPGGPPPAYPGAAPYPNATSPNATQRHLEASEHEDAGRGLEYAYFQVEGGLEMASLTALKENGILLPGTDKTSGFRPYVGGAAGARFLFMTVGPRFRFAHFTDWNLWTLNLDVGWHAPFGNLETYGTIGAGFAKVALTDDVIARSGDVSISGFDIRFASGIDYYLSPVFSIGAMIGLDLMRLSRGPVSASTSTDPMMPPRPVEYGQDASGLGLVFHGGPVAGLHF